MKVVLTADEQKQLDYALKNNTVRKWLTHKDKMKFEVGDVLIRLMRGYHKDEYGEYKWRTENIMSGANVPQRYVYIYEDEHGIGYIKPLKVSDGLLGKELLCMTEYDFDSTQFQVDPEYAEHVLLDADFNIKSIHNKSKEGQKLITKMNRKIGTRPNTFTEFNAFIEKLKIGDKFWGGPDYTGKHVTEYTLTARKQINVTDLGSSWYFKKFQEKNPDAFDTDKTYSISFTTPWHNSGSTTNYVDTNVTVFFTQEPAKGETKT